MKVYYQATTPTNARLGDVWITQSMPVVVKMCTSESPGASVFTTLSEGGGGSGTPGGASGSIQFNDATDFGGFGHYDGADTVTLPKNVNFGSAATWLASTSDTYFQVPGGDYNAEFYAAGDDGSQASSIEIDAVGTNVLAQITAVVASGLPNIHLFNNNSSTNYQTHFLTSEIANFTSAGIIADKNGSSLNAHITAQVDETGTPKYTTVNLVAGDALGIVSMNVNSPALAGGGGAASVDIGRWKNTSGGGTILNLQAPDGFNVGLIAPDAPGADKVFTMPQTFPAANGQPLVSSTGGALSFAAGQTGTINISGLTSLTFTGGVLTGHV